MLILLWTWVLNILKYKVKNLYLMTKKQSMIFKILNIITQIFNEYMQKIYLGIDEVWNYITKGVKENHHDCNILKNVMW